MNSNLLEKYFPSNEPIEELDFKSTRHPENTANAWEALVTGQAKDGGLYVPDISKINTFETEFFQHSDNPEEPSFYDLTMSQTSALLLRQFIPSEGKNGLSNESLQAMMDISHNFDIPLEKLNANTLIAWLSESETASFKDFAARAISQLMEYYCEKEQTPKNIVVATSGDTGVAIADAFGNSKWITVTVLYPNGKVSPVQEAQMINAAKKYPNVQCLPIDGDFDKTQAFSKSMQFMKDLDTSQSDAIQKLQTTMQEQLNISIADNIISDLSEQLQELELASANSINIWRLLPQMTQYFASYSKAVNENEIQPAEKIIFAIPTGNVGHLMAGMYAKQLGLPVKKFIVGTNSNDIVTCTIRDFELNHQNLTRNAKNENEAMATESPSMDIADPSNLERLLNLIQDLADPETTLDLEQLKKDTKALNPGQAGIPLSKYGVTEKMKEYINNLFYASSVSDEESISVMNHYKEVVQLEPHGATAVKAVEDAQKNGNIETNDKVIVFETAHRDKFPSALKKAKIKVEKTHHILKDLNTNEPKNPEPIVETVAKVVSHVKTIADTSIENRSNLIIQHN